MKLTLLTVLASFTAALSRSSNEVTKQGMAIKAMEKVFSRSERAHRASMAAIMRSMSMHKAVEVLENSDNSNSLALAQVTNMAIAGHSNLRKQPKGYAGLDGARKLLNDMIFESMTKYDAEIAKCTEYYAQQCAAMEACRSQIAASNYIAANSRALILDNQAIIGSAEVDIPEGEQQLKQHNLKCREEIKRMNARLKIVLGDIAVMTMILEMTDC